MAQPPERALFAPSPAAWSQPSAAERPGELTAALSEERTTASGDAIARPSTLDSSRARPRPLRLSWPYDQSGSRRTASVRPGSAAPGSGGLTRGAGPLRRGAAPRSGACLTRERGARRSAAAFALQPLTDRAPALHQLGPAARASGLHAGWARFRQADRHRLLGRAPAILVVHLLLVHLLARKLAG